MPPDELQTAWQSEAAQAKVSVDADLLLKVAQRDQQDFRFVSAYSDYMTAAFSLLLVPVWIYLGMRTESPWTWYLSVPVLLWTGGLRLAYGIGCRREPSHPEEPLVQCVQESLDQVEAQVRSQRRYALWELLPLAAAIQIATAHSAWLRSDGWLDLLTNVHTVVFMLAAFGFVYWLNRHFVAKYEPRRMELMTLLGSLREAPRSDDSQEVVAASISRMAGRSLRVHRSPASTVSGSVVGFGGIVALLAVAMYMLDDAADRPRRGERAQGESTLWSRDGASRVTYSKRSPFTGVRWVEDQPEVQVGEEWFKFVSLDDIPTSDILSFSRDTYGSDWKKRFAEDLVELLTRMGHPPGDAVTLVLKSPVSLETFEWEGVPMTEENRQAVYNAHQE